MIKRIFVLISTLIVAVAGHTASYKPDLQFPVKCELGQNCYIQHYVDLDPSLEVLNDNYLCRLTTITVAG